jgi:isochorismate synthase
MIRSTQSIPSPFGDIFQRPGRLISQTVRCPAVPLLHFLRYARGLQRIYWESSTTAVSFAGVGAAVSFSVNGRQRIASLKEDFQALYQSAEVEGPPEIGARLFGGLSFAPSSRPDPLWSAFPDGYFVVPRFVLTRQHDAMWLTINRYVTELDAEWGALQDERDALLQWIETATDEGSPLPPLVSLAERTPEAAWTAQIERIHQGIQASTLRKVVLARTVEAAFTEPPDLLTALGNLSARYANTYRFLIEPAPGQAFYGATPELLVSVDGRQLRTAGVAGSRRRGSNTEADHALGAELLGSAKDLYEHRIVVETIQHNLAALTDNLHIPAEPKLMKLANIQHLYTPIEGSLRADTHILDVVARLHPTPALGGFPAHLALGLIDELERDSRGWYGAPVGWIDHRGNGLFAVAIRSALGVGKQTRFYAGAGIVETSDPHSEWLETEVKLLPMLTAHGLEGDRS